MADAFNQYVQKTAVPVTPQVTAPKPVAVTTRPTAPMIPNRADGEKLITDYKNQYANATDDAQKQYIANQAKATRKQYNISDNDPYYGNNDATYIGQGSQAPVMPTNLLQTMTPEQMNQITLNQAKQKSAGQFTASQNQQDYINLLKNQLSGGVQSSLDRLAQAKAASEKGIYQNDFEQRQRAKLDAVSRGMEDSSVLENMNYGINQGTTQALGKMDTEYGMNMSDLEKKLLDQQQQYDLQLNQLEQSKNKSQADIAGDAMNAYLQLFGQQSGLAQGNRQYDRGVMESDRNFGFQEEGAKRQADQFQRQLAETIANRAAQQGMEQQRLAETIRANKANEGIQGDRYNYDKTMKTRDDLMNVWKLTGYAPEGLEAYGVKAGTKYVHGDQSNEQLPTKYELESTSSGFDLPKLYEDIQQNIKDVKDGKSTMSFDDAYGKPINKIVGDMAMKAPKGMTDAQQAALEAQLRAQLQQYINDQEKRDAAPSWLDKYLDVKINNPDNVYIPVNDDANYNAIPFGVI